MAIFTCERLAYNLGIISPNKRMMKVTPITWMINPNTGLPEKSNKELTR